MMPAEHAFAAVRQYLMPLSLSHTHTSPPSALSLKRLSACSHEIFSCRRRRRRVRASTAEPCWVCAWPLADGRLGLLFQARGGVANVQVRHLVRIRIPPPSFCPFSSWASRPIKNGCGCRDNPHGFFFCLSSDAAVGVFHHMLSERPELAQRGSSTGQRWDVWCVCAVSTTTWHHGNPHTRHSWRSLCWSA